MVKYTCWRNLIRITYSYLFDICILDLLSTPLSTKQIWVTTVKIALNRASRARYNKEQEMQLAMERWTSGRIRCLCEYNSFFLAGNYSLLTMAEMHFFFVHNMHVVPCLVYK